MEKFSLALEYMLIEESELFFKMDFFFLNWLCVVPQLGTCLWLN